MYVEGRFSNEPMLIMCVSDMDITIPTTAVRPED